MKAKCKQDTGSIDHVDLRILSRYRIHFFRTQLDRFIILYVTSSFLENCLFVQCQCGLCKGAGFSAVCSVGSGRWPCCHYHRANPEQFFAKWVCLQSKIVLFKALHRTLHKMCWGRGWGWEPLRQAPLLLILAQTEKRSELSGLLCATTFVVDAKINFTTEVLLQYAYVHEGSASGSVILHTVNCPLLGTFVLHNRYAKPLEFSRNKDKSQCALWCHSGYSNKWRMLKSHCVLVAL